VPKKQPAPLSQVSGAASRAYNTAVASLRFRSHQRMKSPGSFARVFRQGSRARSGCFVVALAPNGLDHSRLGLSVGKRIWKGAVQRNYVRRVFREAFRLSQHELPVGYDIVLIPARPNLVPVLGEACEELVAMARKACDRYEQAQAQKGDGTDS
jgi:ribonuclease P protein component